jgi:hypothetical protein
MQGSSSLREEGFEVTLNIDGGNVFFSLKEGEKPDPLFNQENLKDFLIKKQYDKLVFRNVKSLFYKEDSIYSVLLHPCPTREKIICSNLADAKKKLIQLINCSEKQADDRMKNLVGMKCKNKYSFTVGSFISKSDSGNGGKFEFTGYSKDQSLLDLESFDILPFSEVRKKEGLTGEDLIPIMPRCNRLFNEWDLICGFVDNKTRTFTKWFICSHQFYRFWQIIFAPSINIDEIPQENRHQLLKNIIGQKSDKNFKIDNFNPKLFITSALDRKIHMRAKEQGTTADHFKHSLLNRSEAADRPIHTYVALSLVAMFDIDYRKANSKVLDNADSKKGEVGLKNWDLPKDFFSHMSSLIRKELDLPSIYPGPTFYIQESKSERMIERQKEKERLQDEILFSFFRVLQEKWTNKPSSRPKVMTPRNNGYNAFCWDFSESINQKIDLSILDGSNRSLPSLSQLDVPMASWQVQYCQVN